MKDFVTTSKLPSPLETVIESYMTVMWRTNNEHNYNTYLPSIKMALKELRTFGGDKVYIKPYMEFRKMDEWKKDNGYKKKEDW